MELIILSKIKIFSLGGLDENGKNMYVIEIDKDIFIFDCGLKYASGNMLGIDYIIPDFTYLVKNKKRIKGLFITHGHLENMGATADLLSVLCNIFCFFSFVVDFCAEYAGTRCEKIYNIDYETVIVFDPYFVGCFDAAGMDENNYYMQSYLLYSSGISGLFLLSQRNNSVYLVYGMVLGNYTCIILYRKFYDVQV